MVVCGIFWLIAIPLIVKLWSLPNTEIFSWEERLVGTILLFLPVIGVVFWGLYFQIPPSKKLHEIFPNPENRGVSGTGRAMWTMAETARQNASIPEGELQMPKNVRRVWRILRWPFLLGLVGVVVWFNALLIR